MNKLSISLKEFLKDPEHHFKEGRQKDAVLLIHADSGCLIAAVLTKQQYQPLLQNGVL